MLAFIANLVEVGRHLTKRKSSVFRIDTDLSAKGGTTIGRLSGFGLPQNCMSLITNISVCFRFNNSFNNNNKRAKMN